MSAELVTHHIEFPDLVSGTTLRGRFILPADAPHHCGVVVYLTGDGPKGSKSLSWVNLPPIMAERGIASFLFDFEGLGYSDGERRLLTVSKGLSNFRTAWQVVTNSALIDHDRIGVLGSSFGGTVALLAPDIINSSSSLGLKSPASFLADAYVNEIGDRVINPWAAGFSEELGYDSSVLFEALLCNPFSSARLITTPTLITHGTSDDVVPVRQSKYLSHCLSGEAKLELFESVGHSYSEGDAWIKMAILFADWFETRL